MSLFVKKPINVLMGEAQAEGAGTLKRTLGPGNLIALGIGAIIGAGLFVRTAAAAAQACRAFSNNRIYCCSGIRLCFCRIFVMQSLLP